VSLNPLAFEYPSITANFRHLRAVRRDEARVDGVDEDRLEDSVVGTLFFVSKTFEPVEKAVNVARWLRGLTALVALLMVACCPWELPPDGQE